MMKWRSEWWGIEIMAESDEDDKFLERLHAMLPAKLDHQEMHEDGTLDLRRHGMTKHIILRFNR